MDPEFGRDLHLRPASALEQRYRLAFERGGELSSRLRHSTSSPLAQSVSEVSVKPREDQFLRHSDDRISFLASEALGRLRHSEIRDTALNSVGERQLAKAMRLLVRNYQPGDMDHVRVSIDAAAADEDELHSLQFAVREVLRHSSVDREEAVRMLMRMYELITCSLCRGSILKALEGRIVVPSWIVEECAFDADPDVVAIAIEHASSHRRADV